MYQNIHMHTYRCHHAHGTEEQYVQRALEGGFKDIGFSDHSPLPSSFLQGKPNVASIRMDESLLDEYCDTIRALSEKYRESIKIRLGTELEYIPAVHSQTIENLKNAGIEYIILGEHLICGGSRFSDSPTNDPDLLKEYVDMVLEGAATGDFNLVAHPDLIKYTSYDDIYQSEMTRLCSGLKEMNMPIELNLYGLYSGRNYPNKTFWSIAAEIGNIMVINSDAHRPELVWAPEVIEQAHCWIKELGLNYTDKILN